MNKAMVSLSFDDGRGDNLTVAKQILLPHHIPATFNITTGYVDRTCPEEYSPSPLPAMSVEDVVWLGKQPEIELALHGDQHKNTLEDIAAGREKLIRWMELDENAVFGFASPGSGFSVENSRNPKEALLRDQICYFRTSLRIKKYTALRVLARKAGRVIHLPFFYQLAYGDTIMDKPDDRIIYSVPILRDITAEQVIAVVKQCIRRGGFLTLMFHSVMQEGEPDNCSWKWEKFEKLTDFLIGQREKGNLDIVTTQELFVAMQERV